MLTTPASPARSEPQAAVDPVPSAPTSAGTASDPVDARAASDQRAPYARCVDDRIGLLARLMTAGDTVVLSGAGMSTDSGIPDYRGPTGAMRRHAPTTYDDFVSDVDARRRYWA